MQLPLKCHMALFRAPAGSLPTLAAATLAAARMLAFDNRPSSMLLMWKSTAAGGTSSGFKRPMDPQATTTSAICNKPASL